MQERSWACSKRFRRDPKEAQERPKRGQECPKGPKGARSRGPIETKKRQGNRVKSQNAPRTHQKAEKYRKAVE